MKILRKGGISGPPILYEVSIVVLIDFIAILLTPGIFLIQIIQICIKFIFIVKILLKCVFQKVCFLKF